MSDVTRLAHLPRDVVADAVAHIVRRDGAAIIDDLADRGVGGAFVGGPGTAAPADGHGRR